MSAKNFSTSPANSSTRRAALVAACMAALLTGACNFVDSPNIPPLFKQQPQSTTVRDGEFATFTVVVDDYYKDSYTEIRWSIDGVTIPGAVGNTLSRQFAYLDNGKRIRAMPWLGSGSIGDSDPAVITVTAVAPTFSGTLPALVTAAVGSQIQLVSPIVMGTAPIAYQWSRNGVAIAGAVAETLTLSNIGIDDSSAQFAVTVSNLIGAVTSNSTTLLVQ